MKKIYFECDYHEGAHDKVMKRLLETNLEQTMGYGEDPFCEEARRTIRKLCGKEDLAVHFLVGGTQTNLTVIAAALRPHQGVIAADCGHINVHETGAIESCGHKVLALPSVNGKITAGQVETYCRAHIRDDSFEHMVQPGMVYISSPTEYGTVYHREELEDLSRVCREYGLYLFLDGARLGYGLTARENDLDMETIAGLCDAFYIGGTKCGALFGEAVVITSKELQKDFRYIMKQKGGMLAKGRLLGIQFQALLEDGLYFEIASHANRLADRIREACKTAGYSFFVETQTNQIFVNLPEEKLEELEKKYVFAHWQKTDEQYMGVRICTSWATREEDVEKLIQDLLKN